MIFFKDENPSFQKTLPKGRFKPSQVYQRRPPHNSPIVKTLFKGSPLPDNHLQSYQAFTDLLKKRWATKKDSGMILMQFNQIKKKENETVKEFDVRFDNLLSHIPKNLCPS
jgi:hypothetical protein